MRIKNKFEELMKKGKKALITYTVAGDPDLNTTKRLILEMEKNGADIIEIGIPYSDPIAEGPVIEKANARALIHDIKLDNVFALVKDLRVSTEIPLVFLLYYNCIYKYGAERFFNKCKMDGVDGIIIPDLPFEEKSEIKEIAESFEIDIISLVTPASKARIKSISEDAKGFLYCVSSYGVTGVRKDFDTNFEEFFEVINKYSSVPTAIGFGISSPEQVESLKKYSDGVIVGSAIVRLIEESSTEDEAVKKVGSFTKSLRDALDK